jgi:hypothetical protein
VKTLLDTTADVGIRFRVKQLRALNSPRWGNTNAPRVLAHMIEVLESPLQDSKAREAGGLRKPLRIAALRWAYLQGRPCEVESQLVVPQELTPADLEKEWEGLPQAWYAAADRFVARVRSRAPLPAHPMFGPLAHEEWGRIVYLHTDYHLRQLGV